MGQPKAGLQHLKKPALVALGAMLALLLGACFFWKERMLFYDAAFISFRIINYGSLQIIEHRYGSFITQIVPLIGSYFHLSLKGILIAYSLSFPLFYLFVFLWLLRGRVYTIAILLAFYFTLFVSDAYFWTNNEVHQGTAWLLLWLGVLLKDSGKESKPVVLLLLSLPLLFLAISSHPLVIFSAGFLWVFLLLDGRLKKLPVWLLVTLSVALLCLILIKQQLSRNGWYDADKIEHITQASTRGMLQACSNDMSRNFLAAVVTNYWLFPILLLAGLIMLWHSSKKLLLLWTLVCLAGLYLLICLSFPNWLSFHSESEWMTFSLIGATPFVFYVLPRLKEKQAALALGFIFLVRFVYIGISAATFIERRQRTERMVDKMSEKKLSKVALLRQGNSLSFGTLEPWGLPVETLYAAALKGEKIQSSAIETDSSSLDRIKALQPRQLAGPWEDINPEEVNSRYFSFDTSSSYRVMTLQELMQ